MEAIITALKKIEEEGSFCGMRTAPMNKLKIEIKDFGALAFPLTPRKAKALIKYAKPAKFGWRDQTLLDKTVRHAWEISKRNIKIDTRLWNTELTLVLDELKKDLGLPDEVTLRAQLHNLLIYEPGQFFSPHQDSEKLDGMVASLVIVLPSEHRGGSLIIDHQGEKKQFQTSRFPLDKLTFIAFYADCHHEVKAVKDGHRLTLTYNLVVENKDKKGQPPSITTSYDELTQSLRRYFADEYHAKEASAQHKTPKQFVYLLDHSYTQKGLSWNHLKNGDRLRAEAFKAAADTLDLEISMALADVQETWDCEMHYDPYEYRSRRRYFYDEDDNEDQEEEFDEDNVELNDLINRNTVLKHWIDRENKPLRYQECHVSDSHIGWTKASDKFEPFQSEYEGYMGNYGNTLDRWYHRAAIILWRKKDHYPVLFEMDPASVIDELLSLSKKKAQEEHVRLIVRSLLPCWSEYLWRHSKNSVSTIFKLALYVKDPQLAQAMTDSFDIKVLTPERTPLFLSLQESYGTAWCLSIFQAWTKSKDRWGSISKCEKISEIVTNLAESKQGHKELTDWLLAYQLKKIIELNELCKKQDTRAELIKSRPERMKDIMEFIMACVIVNNNSVYIDSLNHIMNNSKLYPPHELINVVYTLKKSLNQNTLEQWQYKKLFNYIYQEIKKERDLGLRKKEDWSITEIVSCKCQDCAILSEFLQSDTVRNMRWPMGKDRRVHIHQTIDGLGIPVTHQTEHTGSPHKLILVKTDKLYSQAKQRFDHLEKALTRLAKLNRASKPR